MTTTAIARLYNSRGIATLYGRKQEKQGKKICIIPQETVHCSLVALAWFTIPAENNSTVHCSLVALA